MENPSAKRTPQLVINNEWREHFKIISFLTSPMPKQIPVTIWGTKMQLQHIFFRQSNDQDI